VVRFRWADHAMALRYHAVIHQAALQLMRDFFLRHGA
jgi:hypothetical protein